MTDSFKYNATEYKVYVMRIWREQTTSTVCRFSLEDPNTRQRRGFSTLSELVAYLEGETGYFDQESLEPTKRRHNP